MKILNNFSKNSKNPTHRFIHISVRLYLRVSNLAIQLIMDDFGIVLFSKHLTKLVKENSIPLELLEEISWVQMSVSVNNKLGKTSEQFFSHLDARSVYA